MAPAVLHTDAQILLKQTFDYFLFDCWNMCQRTCMTAVERCHASRSAGNYPDKSIKLTKSGITSNKKGEMSPISQHNPKFPGHNYHRTMTKARCQFCKISCPKTVSSLTDVVVSGSVHKRTINELVWDRTQCDGGQNMERTSWPL